MCLAEALLRIPDAATRDALIRDKIAQRRLAARTSASSPSLFVNAATWGLLLTGKLVATHSEAGLSAALTRAGRQRRRAADPQGRRHGDAHDGRAVRHRRDDRARRWPTRAQREAEGFRYSYDMLGEAALTGARRGRATCAAYEARDPRDRQAPRPGAASTTGPGISIKLSALHPRYGRAQRERVMAELYPRAAARWPLLAQQLRHRPEHRRRGGRPARAVARPARAAVLRAGAGRLERHRLRGPGLPEALPVRDRLSSIDLARRSGHRLMVRLVKGAYWDSEIKRAQVDGLDGYPVYTRKVYTDVVLPRLRAQAAGRAGRGLPAVRDAQRAHAGRDLRAWPARTITPGSTSSSACTAWASRCTSRWSARSTRASSAGRAASTRRSARTRRCWPTWCAGCWKTAPTPRSSTASPTDAVPLEELVADPVAHGRAAGRARKAAVGLPHPAHPAAARAVRRASAPTRAASTWPTRSRCAALRQPLRRRRADDLAGRAAARPIDARRRSDRWQPVLNPADRRDVVGRVREATADDVEPRWPARRRRRADWAATAAGRARGACSSAPPTCWKPTCRALIGAAGARGRQDLRQRASPKCARRSTSCATTRSRRATTSTTTPIGRSGPVVCISPWNFPLAIFTGQVAAALAAGNPVLAKPAEQTPLVAAEAVRAAA